VRPRRAALALALLLSAPLAAQQGNERARPGSGLADPSAVIAADIALSREARERGEAEGLRRAAADAALVLVPDPQPAAKWLKGRSLSSPPPEWDPRTVWLSCDGGYAVILGAWSRGSQGGTYLALWQRQRKGEWRWLLHEDGPAETLGSEPEMIAGRVAECAGLPPRPRGFVPPPVSPLKDASRDGSLEWSVTATRDCALSVSARAWDGKSMVKVLTWSRPAPTAGCSRSSESG
jgi:hypothetical protein